MDKKDSLCGRVMDGVTIGLQIVVGMAVITLPVWIGYLPSRPNNDATSQRPPVERGAECGSPYDHPPTGPIKDFGSFDYYPPNYWSGNEGR